MRILYDTNIVLDLFLERKPYVMDALQLFNLLENGTIKGFLCATTITTLEYLLNKTVKPKKSHDIISTLLKLFDIAPVNRLVIEEALTVNFHDFEDAVLYQSAIHCGAEGIVTRDIKGFKSADFPIYNPKEMLAIIASQSIIKL